MDPVPLARRPWAILLAWLSCRGQTATHAVTILAYKVMPAKGLDVSSLVMQKGATHLRSNHLHERPKAAVWREEDWKQGGEAC